MGDLLIKDLAPTVFGGLVREEDEGPQREAGIERVDRNHRAAKAEVGTAPVPQEDRRSHRRLDHSPGTLDQEKEKFSQTCHPLIGHTGGLFGPLDQFMDLVIGGLLGDFSGFFVCGDVDVL